MTAGHDPVQRRRPSGATIRLSRKLVSLHIASIAALILIVVGSVLWVSVEHNKLARASSEQRVESGIAAVQRRMEDVVRDYSIWDDAYAAIRGADAEWLYSNIGSSAAEIATVDLIVIVDPEHGRTFGWRAGSPVGGEADLLPADLTAALLARLDAAAAAGDPEGSAFANLNGEIWAFAMTAVHPVGGIPDGVAAASLPRQIHGLRMGPQLAGDLAGSLMVGELGLAPQPVPGMAAAALADASGAPVGYVVWTPPRPGVSILRKVGPPLGLAVLAVGVLAGAVARFIVRAAGNLERARDAAQAADRSKTEFLSNVSHELRTPMNGIMGVAQLLELTELDQEQRELVDVLAASARTQMSLICDLLDITRIESGNRQAAREPFEPEEVLRELVELVRTAAVAKRLTVESDLDALHGLRVEGDERAFRQIMTNLLGNAVKFTDEGLILLEARAAVDCGRAALELRVCDTGQGIAPEDLPRIFDRFVQVDSSRARRAEGTGLGLSISRKLADTMGGTIGVESLPGVGSTFTFRVVLDLAAAERDRPAPRAADAPQGRAA